MTESYHFGIKASVVWISHILIGAFLIYAGYASLNNAKLPNYINISIIVLGALALLYHSHIWIIEKEARKDNKDTEENKENKETKEKTN